MLQGSYRFTGNSVLVFFPLPNKCRLTTDTRPWLLGSRGAEKEFVLILTAQKLLYLSSSDMREEAGRAGPGKPVSVL